MATSPANEHEGSDRTRLQVSLSDTDSLKKLNWKWETKNAELKSARLQLSSNKERAQADITWTTINDSDPFVPTLEPNSSGETIKFDKNTGVICCNLKLKEKYKVKLVVSADSKEKETVVASLKFCTVHYYMPRDINVILNEDDPRSSIDVKWTKPKDGKHDTYQLKLFNSGGEAIEQEKTQSCCYTFYNLASDQSLYVEITTVVGEIKSSVTSDIVKTKYSADDIPTNAKISSNENYRSIDMEWQKPKDQEISEFQCALFTDDGKPVQGPQTASSTKITFDSLQLGKKYYGTVRSIQSGGRTGYACCTKIYELNSDKQKVGKGKIQELGTVKDLSVMTHRSQDGEVTGKVQWKVSGSGTLEKDYLLDSFRVEWREQKEKKSLQKDITLSLNQENSYHYSITLQPGRKYTIRVIAMFKDRDDGTLHEAAVEEEIHPEISQPKLTVTYNDGKIRFAWIKVNGAAEYKMRVTNSNDESQVIFTKETVETCLVTPMNTQMTYGKRCRFTLTAVDDSGAKITAKPVEGTIGGPNLPHSITLTRSMKNPRRCLELNWITDSNTIPKILGVHLHENDKRKLTVKPDGRNVQFCLLKSSTTYYAKVEVDVRGSGTVFCPSNEVMTAKAKQSTVIQHLTECHPTRVWKEDGNNATEALIKWSEVDLGEEYKTIKYNIKVVQANWYGKIRGIFLDGALVKTDIPFRDAKEISVTGLKPNITYKATVKTMVWNIDEEKELTLKETTIEFNGPICNPKLQETAYDGKFAVIQWESVPADKLTLEIKEALSENVLLSQDVRNSSNYKFEMTGEFRVGRKCEVRLTANASKSNVESKWSPWIIGGDKVPCDVMVTKNCDNPRRQLDIHFKKPGGSLQPKEYEIETCPSKGTHKMEQTSKTDYTFKHLRSNTTYTIRVTAVYENGDKSMASVSDTFTTDPCFNSFSSPAVNDLSRSSGSSISFTGKVRTTYNIRPNQIKDVVEDVEVKLVDDSNPDKDVVKLSWKPPLFSNNQENYVVNYCEWRVLDGVTKSSVQNGQVDSVEEKGVYETSEIILPLGKSYEFEIRTNYEDIDEDKRDQTSDPRHEEFHTRPRKPGNVVFKCDNKEERVIVKWDASEGDTNYDIYIYSCETQQLLASVKKETRSNVTFKFEEVGYWSECYAQVTALRKEKIHIAKSDNVIIAICNPKLQETAYDGKFAVIQWESVRADKLTLEIKEALSENVLLSKDVRISSNYTFEMTGEFRVGRKCEVRLTANASKSNVESKWTPWIIGGDKVPCDVMVTKNCDNPRRHLDIHFKKPGGSLQPKEYEIETCPSKGIHKMEQTSKTDYTFKHLRSNTTYTIRVTAIYENGDKSMASVSDTFTTDPCFNSFSSPAVNDLSRSSGSSISFTGKVRTTYNIRPNQIKDVVEDVEVKLVDDSNPDKDVVKLSWKPPLFSNNQENYVVNYCEWRVLDGVTKSSVQNGQVDSVEGKGVYETSEIILPLGKSYEFEIRTNYEDIDEDKRDQTSDPRHEEFHTRPRKPGNVVFKCDNKEESVIVNWDASEGDTNYDIYIYSCETQQLLASVKKETKSNVTFKFEEVGYGSECYAQVTALRKEKIHIAKSDNVIIGGDTVPRAARAERDLNSPTTAARVTWSPPLKSPDGYLVLAIDADSHDPAVEIHKAEFKVGDQGGIITNLKPGTKYFFKVFAFHQGQRSAGCKTDSPILTKAGPGKVKNFTASPRVNDKGVAIQVRWDREVKCTEYRLLVEREKHRQEFSTKETAYLVTELSPRTKYTLRVAGGNENEFGNYTNPEFVVTDMGRPSHVVLAHDKNTPESAVLELVFEGSGESNVEYLATLYEGGKQVRTKTSTTISMRFDNLKPNKKYHTKVQVQYMDTREKGKGVFSNEIYTAPSRPENIEAKLKIVDGIAEDIIKLKWYAESGCNKHRINVWRGTKSEELRIVEGEQECEYECPDGTTDYSFTIQSMNASMIFSPPSAEHVVKLAPRKVRKVIATLKDDEDVIEVNWEKNDNKTTSYLIKPIVDGKPQKGDKIFSTQWKIEAKHYMEYFFRVYPQGETDLPGQFTDSNVVQSRPQHVRLTSATRCPDSPSTSIRVTWEDLTISDIKYELKIRSFESDRAEPLLTFRGETSHVCDCKFPGGKYELRVRAKRGDIAGLWSKGKICQLAPSAVKDVHAEIKQGLSEKKVIEVTWKPLGEHVTGYIVEAQSITGEKIPSYKISKINDEIDATGRMRAEISGFPLGRDYVCTVYAVNDKLQGDASLSNSVFAGWEKPRDFSVALHESDPAHKATIKWTKPGGVEAFELLISDSNGKERKEGPLIEPRYEFQYGRPGEIYELTLRWGSKQHFDQDCIKNCFRFAPAPPMKVSATSSLEKEQPKLKASLKYQHTKPDYFIVKVKEDATGEIIHEEKSTSGELAFDGVKHGEVYIVSVHAVINGLEQYPSEEIWSDPVQIEFPSTSATSGARPKRTARKEKERDLSRSSSVDEEDIISAVFNKGGGDIYLTNPVINIVAGNVESSSISGANEVRPNPTVEKASPGPKNLRMTFSSDSKSIIECDDSPSATAYHFFITCEVDEEKPKYPPTTEIEEYPKHHFSQQGWKELTVTVRSKSEKGFSDSSIRKFRNVIRIIQKHSTAIAENIISKRKYVKPQFLTKSSNIPDTDFDTSVNPKSGEVVVVQALSFGGKTSVCSYLIQTDSGRLPVFIDVDKFSFDEKLDYEAFFKKCMKPLTDNEMKMLLDWMERHSQDIVFIVDNAPFLGKTPELIAHCSEGASVLDLQGNLINPQRLTFPKAAVLCTTSLSAQFQMKKLSRVIEITKFAEKDMQTMAKHGLIGKEVYIPRRHRFLCANAGFCSAILENIALHRKFTSVGHTLIEILAKLLKDLYEDPLRTQKISELRDTVVAAGRDSDIAPRKKTRPISDLEFTNLDEIELSCKRLQNEYQIVLFHVFFMPWQEFNKCFERDRTPGHEHLRKWEMIAGLLRKDVYEKGEALFMQKLPGFTEKSGTMKKFIRSKADKIKETILTNPEIAAGWFNCAFELGDESVMKKYDVPKKLKRPEHKKNMDIFLDHIAEEFEKKLQVIGLSKSMHEKSNS